MVLGSTRRTRWSQLTRGSVADDLQRQLVGVDVHIIAGEPEPSTGTPTPPQRDRRISAIPRQRERMAWFVFALGIPLLTVLLVQLRDHLNLTSALLLQLALVLAISALGGIRPGVLASVAAFLLTNWYFTPPVHTLSIADTDDVTALIVFVAVAIGVSVLVDRSAAAGLARRCGPGPMPPHSHAARDRSSPPMIRCPNWSSSCAPCSPSTRSPSSSHDGDGWTVNAASGDLPPTGPSEGTAIPLDDTGNTQLVWRGAPVPDEELQVLRAFTDQMALGLRGAQARARRRPRWARSPRRTSCGPRCSRPSRTICAHRSRRSRRRSPG